MELRKMISEIHHRIEAKEQGRITQGAMAERLGISTRTYIEYLRGTHAPLSMKVILRLLSQLEDAELLAIVRQWPIHQTTEFISNNVERDAIDARS